MAELVQPSARESLQWLDWLVRLRWPLLLGASLVPLAGACLLLVDVPVHHSTTVAVLFAAVTAPYLVVTVTLFKTLTSACALAQALRQRQHQLAAARRRATVEHPVPRSIGGGAMPVTSSEGHPVAASDTVETSPEARARLARELAPPLHVVEANLAVLSEAFRDILPVLDQHEAVQPHLQIARLEYPFFRSQVPILLEDLSAGVARIEAALRP